MKTAFFFGALAICMVSCTAQATTPANYNVTVNLSDDWDGSMIYMTDFDSGVKLDSTIVEDGKAVFKGPHTSDAMVRLIMDGNRMGDFFLEATDITVSGRDVKSNGRLQADMDAMSARLAALAQEYQSLPDDSTAAIRGNKIQEQYNAVLDSTMNANIDNPLGRYIFLQQAYDLSLAELDAAIKAHPQLGASKRIADLREKKVTKEETSPGHKYKDFTITQPDGSTKRLSDYVGNGHYTLVDFWASWCGPCIRETKVIKQLYEKYNGKGLEVLGVAVWDEPQNTLKAIEQHQLPWNQIINAQTIPTDIYGISGIPCIILIAPDGTIVSRDKQDEELIADVTEAMNNFNQE